MASTGDASTPAAASSEELRTNARLLSLIYDSTSDPVYLVAVEPGGAYRFVSVNESFLRVTGYTARHVVGAPMEQVVPPANVALVRSEYERAIAARAPIVYEERAELPAGTRWAEIALIPIFEGSGPVTHILADIRDATARKAAERQREEILGSVQFLSDATRLLASLDIERALLDVARLAVPFLGDACAVDLLDEDRGPRRVAAVSLDPAEPMPAELRGAVRAGHALVHRVRNVQHLAVPLLVRDRVAGAITLRAGRSRRYAPLEIALVEELGRRAAMAIENARLYRQAEAALAARDEFLAVAAHELRGPVTSIHLAVQALMRRMLPADASLRSLELIEREDRRLARFVDELVDLGRIRARGLQLHLEDVDLREVVQDAVQRLGAELAASGSAITIAAEPGVVGEWDRLRIEQVVANLLSNAIKFGGGKPIELSVSREDGRARLAVRDHGIGVEPAARERIFEPFERNVSARHYGGLGLGLHIVRVILHAMGGTVSVEGAPAAGSTFAVELPLHGGVASDADPRH